MLFTRVFDPNTHCAVVDLEFVSKLYESFGFLKSETVIKDCATILLKLSSMSENVSANPVLEICESHPNHRYFAEVLCMLVNKGNPKTDSYLYQFVKDYYSYTSTPLFLKNDLMVMIDVLLDQVVEVVSVKGVGQLVLECLDALVSTQEYQAIKYRSDEFAKLLTQFKSMGSLGSIRKDNFELFKSICDKVQSN